MDRLILLRHGKAEADSASGDDFDRRLARFVTAHPDLRGRLAQVFRDLEADPFQSHLRLHPLHGDLQGLHAVSVTHSYRITLTLRSEEHTSELQSH